MPARRADLDWLRVALFGLLIIHHVGMFYTLNWGWHAKSQYRSEWLESVLLLVEPWRMPAIWLISGIAIRFVLAKVSLGRYIGLRSLRLLLPLLFGVLVIVPPQFFIEMSAKGEIDMNYWQFLQAFFQHNHPIFENYPSGIWPHIDVNHLWYLRELWTFSLAMVLLLPLLNSQWMMRAVDWLARQHGVLSITLLTLPVLAIEIFIVEGGREQIGFLFLIYGYLLGWHPHAWERLNKALPQLLAVLLPVLGLLVLGYHLVWLDVVEDQNVYEPSRLAVIVIYSLARIVGLMAVLATAQHCFKTKSVKSNNWLGYCNDAVYPFYLLHQSVILVVGYWLTQFSLSFVVEAILVAMATLMICWLVYECARRVDLLRPFFGMKMQGSYSRSVTRLGYVGGGLLVTPLALTLIL